MHKSLAASVHFEREHPEIICGVLWRIKLVGIKMATIHFLLSLGHLNMFRHMSHIKTMQIVLHCWGKQILRKEKVHHMIM